MNSKKVFPLFICLFFLCFSAYSFQTYSWKSVDRWMEASEPVVLSDSVFNRVLMEGNTKHIPLAITNKNLIYFKMLFNPKFDRTERLQIADYIIAVFGELSNEFAMNVVIETKRNLTAQ